MPRSAHDPLAPEWLHRPDDVNAIDPRLWPNGCARDERGVAVIGGVPVDALAAEHGSPLWVLDKATVLSQAREVRDAFAEAFSPLSVRTRVNYASKALLTADLLRWLVAEGLSVDTSTHGELAIALAAGVPGDRIELHGNSKSDAELDLAVTSGVSVIIIDSADEVPQVAAAAARAGVRQRVQLRVVTGVVAHTHEFLQTAGFDQKFGIPRPDLPRAIASVRAAEAEGTLELVGLHCHIGSQIFDTDGFLQSIEALFGFIAQIAPGVGLPTVNLGGGFGIAYIPADSPRPITEIANAFAAAVASSAAKVGVPVPDVSIEPGRFIVGRAGVTLYTVGAVKQVPVDEAGAPTRLYVAVDGGMSDNPRPELYGADYSAVLASRASDAPPTLSRVVGKHCETGDIAVHDLYLPSDVARGDVIAVATTGAYAFSLSSNYNLLTRPALVSVDAGQTQVLIRRETLAQLIARDQGLAGATDLAR